MIRKDYLIFNEKVINREIIFISKFFYTGLAFLFSLKGYTNIVGVIFERTPLIFLGIKINIFFFGIAVYFYKSKQMDALIAQEKTNEILSKQN